MILSHSFRRAFADRPIRYHSVNTSHSKVPSASSFGNNTFNSTHHASNERTVPNQPLKKHISSFGRKEYPRKTAYPVSRDNLYRPIGKDKSPYAPNSKKSSPLFPEDDVKKYDSNEWNGKDSISQKFNSSKTSRDSFSPRQTYSKPYTKSYSPRHDSKPPQTAHGKNSFSGGFNRDSLQKDKPFSKSKSYEERDNDVSVPRDRSSYSFPFKPRSEDKQLSKSFVSREKGSFAPPDKWSNTIRDKDSFKSKFDKPFSKSFGANANDKGSNSFIGKDNDSFNPRDAKPFSKSLKGKEKLQVDESSFRKAQGGKYNEKFSSKDAENAPQSKEPWKDQFAPLQPRELWFSDPHLLSKKIHSLLKSPHSIPEALELVQKHTGAATPHVYGVLLQGLSNAGDHEKVLDIWSNSNPKGRRILSGMGYTILISSLTTLTRKGASKSDFSARAKQFGIGMDIWNQMSMLRDEALSKDIDTESAKAKQARSLTKELRDGYLIHCNSMINFCVETAHVGGLDLGKRIFETIVPDERGYTSMLRLCSEAMDSETGIKIWTDMPVEFRSERSLGAFVQMCSRSSKEVAINALELIHEYYGLPKSHKGSSSNGKFGISNATLMAILRVAGKIQFPALGQRWFDISIERGAIPDTGVYEAVFSLMLTSKNFNGAWDLMPQLGGKTFENGFRLCADAVHDNPSFWEAKCSSLMEEASKTKYKMQPRDLANIVLTLARSESWDSLYAFVSKHQSTLISATREISEEILSTGQFKRIPTLYLRMESLGAISEMLKKTNADEMSHYLLSKRVKEAQEMVDLMLKHSKAKDFTSSGEEDGFSVVSTTEDSKKKDSLAKEYEKKEEGEEEGEGYTRLFVDTIKIKGESDS